MPFDSIPTPAQRLVEASGVMNREWYKVFRRLFDRYIPRWTIVNASADTAAAYSDYVRMDATNGLRLVTLPDASLRSGLTVMVRKTDASGNAVRAVGTIDGVENFDLTLQHETLELVSNGIYWDSI